MVGNAYLYKPLIAEDEYKKKFMSGFVRDYFANSYKELVNFFVEEKKLSARELEGDHRADREIGGIIMQNHLSMHLNIAIPCPLYLCSFLNFRSAWRSFGVFTSSCLRRLTFHTSQPVVSTGYTLISFCISFDQYRADAAGWAGGRTGRTPVHPGDRGCCAGGSVVAVAALSRPAGLSAWTVLLWVLAAGSVVLLARMVMRWVSLVRLRRKARLIGGYGVKIYQVDGPVTPFRLGMRSLSISIYIRRKSGRISSCMSMCISGRSIP